MRKTAIALTLTLALAAAAPLHAAPRFTRDTDPIGRFVKFIKKMLGGMTTQDTISIPTPAPTITP